MSAQRTGHLQMATKLSVIFLIKILIHTCLLKHNACFLLTVINSVLAYPGKYMDGKRCTVANRRSCESCWIFKTCVYNLLWILQVDRPHSHWDLQFFLFSVIQFYGERDRQRQLTGTWQLTNRSAAAATCSLQMRTTEWPVFIYLLF